MTLAHGYSINGKTKHKTVENLGYLDDLQKIYDDPIAYFSVIAKQKTLEYNADEKMDLHLVSNVKLNSNTDDRKNLGYSIINLNSPRN